MDFQENPQSILTFRVGPVLCCAPSLPVTSIITPPKLTHPPGSDRAQPGIFRHGSHIVKVIDLRQRFGIDKAEQTDPGHLIITVFGDDSFAFWVDQILDVFDFPTEGWGTLPAAIPRGVFSRTLLLNKKIHLYAEFIKLSSLNDLGYLKHYIQQLKQNEIKQAATTNDTKTPGTKNERLTDEHKTATPGLSPSTLSIPGIAKTEITGSGTNTATGLKNQDIPVPGTGKVKIENRTPVTRSANRVSQQDNAKPVSAVNTIMPRNEINKNNATKNSTPVPARQGIRASQPSQQHPAIASKPGSPAKTPDISLANKSKTTSTSTRSDTAKPVYHDESKLSVVKQATAVDNSNEETSSFAGVFIFLALLLAVVAGTTYLLLSDKSPTITTNVINTPANNEAPVYSAEPVEENMFKATPAVKTPPIIKEEIKTETAATPAYRAEISHEENEITITIHKPVSERKTEEVIAETVTVPGIAPVPEIQDEATISPQVSEKIVIDETTPSNVKTETVKQDEVANPIAKEKDIEEIIHIVVKGDTLWAIAKKYVNDPFLYPELARLSNIKNPHRIYPGNRVRIRFIKD